MYSQFMMHGQNNIKQCGYVTNVSKSVCYRTSDYYFPLRVLLYLSNHGLL